MQCASLGAQNLSPETVKLGLVERDAGRLDGWEDEKSEKLKLLVRCNAG